MLRSYQYISILFTLIVVGMAYAANSGVISWWWLPGLAISYFVFLYFAVTQIQWNYYITSINKGNNTGKLIALTFDDGPNTETGAILDILKKEDVQAAFFCIGKHITSEPQKALRMHEEGHVLANHSYYHTHSFDWMSSHKMLNEIEKCNSTIQQITGLKPLLFRPPYGITNPNLDRAVRRSGMTSIGWSLRSFDTMAKEPQQLKNRILNKLTGGDILLLHDSMSITREILTDLIHEARKKGFTFVRIDKLLHVQAYA